MSVTIEDIRAAADRLNAIAHRTPVLSSRTFDAAVGAEVHFKCENLQRGGAFKFRGAYNAISRLSPEQRSSGVVAFSSGNHAQGVALAAQLLDAPAVIVVPQNAPQVKRDATRGYGAEIVLFDREREDRQKIAGKIAEERGLTLIHAFDHPHIMAGQGTVALELLSDVGDLDALLVPIGGGGLIAGCCIAAHALRPDLRIYGVEPESGNAAFLSLQKGERVTIAQPSSIADGLVPPSPGMLTFPIMRDHLESIVLVSDSEIIEAVRFILMRMKILAEPSGAAAAAALLAKKIPALVSQTVGVVLSGGNVDPATLAKILP